MSERKRRDEKRHNTNDAKEQREPVFNVNGCKPTKKAKRDKFKGTQSILNRSSLARSALVIAFSFQNKYSDIQVKPIA